MPLQQIITTWFALNGSNDETASGIADIRTGAPLYVGGLNIGDYFDLTEGEAKEHSYETVGILHSGRYRRVQVHAGATETDVIKGKFGFMVAALVPNVNVVTSANHGILGVRPVVFLNNVEPGRYCFIQELGVASVLTAGAVTAGAVVSVSAAGTVTAATTQPVGKALQAAGSGQHALVLLDLPVVQG
jgi:hypothetical protein